MYLPVAWRDSSLGLLTVNTYKNTSSCDNLGKYPQHVTNYRGYAGKNKEIK